jgi:hypothetical protein
MKSLTKNGGFQMNEEEKKIETAEEASKAIRGHIVHFPSEEPSAIHLRHVERLRRQGNTLYFDCAYKSYPYPFADEATAENARQAIMKLWAENVV